MSITALLLSLEISFFELLRNNPLEELPDAEIRQPDDSYSKAGIQQGHPEAMPIYDIREKHNGEYDRQQGCPDLEYLSGLC